jgi:mannosyltransferase OCH1-like enzyme
MIPKNFHVVWLGNEKPYFTKEQLNDINTWMAYNPDFRLYVWNDVSREDESIVRHFNMGKLAAASDLFRLKVLYEYGGIYLDDDITCYKSFEPLLSNECFFGVDHTGEDLTVINNAIIGSVPKHPFIGELIEHSFNKFATDTLTYPFGYVVVDVLKKHGFKRGWANLSDEGAEIKTYNGVTIYTGDFFYPGYGRNALNDNTYMRHQYKLRWHDK